MAGVVQVAKSGRNLFFVPNTGVHYKNPVWTFQRGIFITVGRLSLMADNGIKITMTPSHPGDFIRTEIVEELGLNVAQAAEILGVHQTTLSDLLNSNATLSAEMALRIEKAFGISLDTLLRMQAWYDAEQMRARADEIEVKRYQPA